MRPVPEAEVSIYEGEESDRLQTRTSKAALDRQIIIEQLRLEHVANELKARKVMQESDFPHEDKPIYR